MSQENQTEKKFFNYCPSCGAKTGGKAEICPSCGKPVGDFIYDGIPRIGAGGTGYSEITEHESFDAYHKSTKKVIMIALPVIALVVIIALIILGTGPVVAITAGLLLLIVMFIIALVKLRKKPGWEGTVVKKSYTHVKKQGADRHVYTVKFKGEDGKNRSHSWNAHSYVYDYLQEGDRVRYIGNIGGANAFEKYDKSADESIPCACCGHKMDPRYTYCTMCGALLLKGKTE